MARKPSLSIQFRANAEDQRILAELRKKLRLNNAEIVREAIRCLMAKKS